MLELPNPSFHDDGTAKAADQKPRPADPARGARGYLYAATCQALRSWSAEVGFDVAHVGVAADPLTRVAGLRRAGHAVLSYFIRPYEEDLAVGDWHLLPLDLPAAGARLPDGCEVWGGTLRIPLPAGASVDDLARRLAMLLRPLEAHHCAQLPEAVERRAEQQRFLPVLPRYSVEGSRTTLVQDLYKLAGPADLAFVADALGTALAMLGEGRAAFDRVVDTFGSAPSAHQAGYAADAPAPEPADAR